MIYCKDTQTNEAIRYILANNKASNLIELICEWDRKFDHMVVIEMTSGINFEFQFSVYKRAFKGEHICTETDALIITGEQTPVMSARVYNNGTKTRPDYIIVL